MENSINSLTLNCNNNAIKILTKANVAVCKPNDKNNKCVKPVPTRSESMKDKNLRSSTANLRAENLRRDNS